jgi:hypothetical protein
MDEELGDEQWELIAPLLPHRQLNVAYLAVQPVLLVTTHLESISKR